MVNTMCSIVLITLSGIVSDGDYSTIESPSIWVLRRSVFSPVVLDQSYDLYGYFEDDLIIHDPWFFRKIDWFRDQCR